MSTFGPPPKKARVTSSGVNRLGNVLIYVGTIMLCLGFPATLSHGTALGLGVGGVFVLLLGIYMSLPKPSSKGLGNVRRVVGGGVQKKAGQARDRAALAALNAMGAKLPHERERAQFTPLAEAGPPPSTHYDGRPAPYSDTGHVFGSTPNTTTGHQFGGPLLRPKFAYTPSQGRIGGLPYDPRYAFDAAAPAAIPPPPG